MVDRIKKTKAAIRRAVGKVARRIAKIAGEHNLRQTLTVDVWYPDHPPRTTSSTFARTRRRLIDQLQTPCWICGTREDLEVHHFHVEWAFADGVNWEAMRLHHPNFDWSGFREAEDFVDSEYNMLVLCETHHRHNNHGLHNLPYPIWLMQKWKREDFTFCSGECCRRD